MGLLFKHKLACRPSEADLLGSNSAAWHVATLLAREVTTRSVHRFELCARTGSGTAQSWRSVHLLLVSWDSEAATSGMPLLCTRCSSCAFKWATLRRRCTQRLLQTHPLAGYCTWTIG